MRYSLNFVLQIDQAVNTSLHFDLHEGGTLVGMYQCKPGVSDEQKAELKETNICICIFCIYRLFD